MANKPKIKPLGDKVVVKPIEEEVTKSGLVLPETANKEKPQRGKVVAVGSGRVNDEGKKVELEVKPDEVVIFSKYSGTEIKIDNEEYLILSERDILAIVEN
jgi:chaperonin GroES